MKVRAHLKWGIGFYIVMVIIMASAIISAFPMTGATSPVLSGIAVFGAGVTIGNSSKIGHPDPSSPVHSFIGGQILGETISIGNATLVGDIYAADGNLTLASGPAVTISGSGISGTGTLTNQRSVNLSGATVPFNIANTGTLNILNGTGSALNGVLANSGTIA